MAMKLWYMLSDMVSPDYAPLLSAHHALVIDLSNLVCLTEMRDLASDGQVPAPRIHYAMPATDV